MEVSLWSDWIEIVGAVVLVWCCARSKAKAVLAGWSEEKTVQLQLLGLCGGLALAGAVFLDLILGITLKVGFFWYILGVLARVG